MLILLPSYPVNLFFRMFHKNNKQIGINNMFSNTVSITQRFIENYKKLETHYQEEVNPKQLYVEAIELLKISKKVDDEGVDTTSLKSIFKAAGPKKEEHIVKINISHIFKE